MRTRWRAGAFRPSVFLSSDDGHTWDRTRAHRAGNHTFFVAQLGQATPHNLDARLLSHPDLDARAAGQVARAPARPRVSWIGDENTAYARLGEASPRSEATLVDPDDLLADRRARLGDPEKSGRDYRREPPITLPSTLTISPG